MIGQHHPRVDMKWSFVAYFPDHITQDVNFLYKQVASAIKQIDREKENPAGDAATPIVHHKKHAVCSPDKRNSVPELCHAMRIIAKISCLWRFASEECSRMALRLSGLHLAHFTRKREVAKKSNAPHKCAVIPAKANVAIVARISEAPSGNQGPEVRGQQT